METNNDKIDEEPFTYSHFDKIEPTSFVHGLSLAGHENNSYGFNSELC